MSSTNSLLNLKKALVFDIFTLGYTNFFERELQKIKSKKILKLLFLLKRMKILKDFRPKITIDYRVTLNEIDNNNRFITCVELIHSGSNEAYLLIGDTKGTLSLFLLPYDDISSSKQSGCQLLLKKEVTHPIEKMKYYKDDTVIFTNKFGIFYFNIDIANKNFQQDYFLVNDLNDSLIDFIFLSEKLYTSNLIVFIESGSISLASFKVSLIEKKPIEILISRFDKFYNPNNDSRYNISAVKIEYFIDSKKRLFLMVLYFSTIKILCFDGHFGGTIYPEVIQVAAINADFVGFKDFFFLEKGLKPSNGSSNHSSDSTKQLMTVDINGKFDIYSIASNKSFSLSNGEEYFRLPPHKQKISKINQILNSMGHYLIITFVDTSLMFFDLIAKKEVFETKRINKVYTGLKFIYDNVLITIDGHGEINSFMFPKGLHLYRIKQAHIYDIIFIDVIPLGCLNKMIVTAGLDSKIKIWLNS